MHIPLTQVSAGWVGCCCAVCNCTQACTAGGGPPHCVYRLAQNACSSAMLHTHKINAPTLAPLLRTSAVHRRGRPTVLRVQIGAERLRVGHGQEGAPPARVDVPHHQRALEADPLVRSVALQRLRCTQRAPRPQSARSRHAAAASRLSWQALAAALLHLQRLCQPDEQPDAWWPGTCCASGAPQTYISTRAARRSPKP